MLIKKIVCECFRMRMLDTEIHGSDVRAGAVNRAFRDEQAVICFEHCGFFVLKIDQQLTFQNDEPSLCRAYACENSHHRGTVMLIKKIVCETDAANADSSYMRSCSFSIKSS
jgi:hypothetical protein